MGSPRPTRSPAHNLSPDGFHPFHGHISRHFGKTSHDNSTDDLAPDAAYLSYYDVRLTKEDVDSIKTEGEWLTDNAIAFWEEYMEHGVLSTRSAAKICLLRPSMVFMLMQTPDPATLKDALPPLHRFTHIFMPINDNTNPETAEGGSHWTLLLVSLIDDVAFHYDSLRPSNYEPARLATKKLEQVVGKKLTFVDIEDTPQQDNGSDCGIYVCQNMDILTREKLLETEKAKKIDMSLGQTKWDANNVRRNMVATIDDLRKKAIKIESRSRSRSREPSTQPPRIGPGSNAADS